MTKYAFLLDGERFDEDEVFDTYEEAQEAVCEALSNMELGAEILHMSIPGDYPEEDYSDVEIDIIEIE